MSDPVPSLPSTPGDQPVPLASAVPVNVTAAEPVCPLTESHFAMLRQAAVARRPIRTAARTAYISAVTILAVAVLGAVIVLFSPSVFSAIVVVAIGIIGWLEYAGAAKMDKALPAAAAHLGWNQVIFICLIILYCANQMLSNSSTPLFSSAERAQLLQADSRLVEIERWAPMLNYFIYSVVILLSVVFQGGLATYYFTRRRHLVTLQQATPAWIRRVLDTTAP